MSTANPSSPNSTKLNPPPALGADKRQPTLRERYARNWLLRLASLPPRSYQETVERLRRGDSTWAVARWLARHPNRGGLSNVGEYSLRKYISVLAEQVEKQKRLHPGPTVGDLQASGMVAPLPELPIPAPAPLARRPGAKYQTARMPRRVLTTTSVYFPR